MHLQPLFALLFVQLLFGALPVASKFVLNHAHPLIVVVLRSLFATGFFAFLHLLQRSWSAIQSSASPIEPEHGQQQKEITRAKLPFSLHARIAGLAFFGITFNQMALFIALPQTSAAIAAIISPSIALFTLFFSVLLGRESFQKLSMMAILLGACGVFLVVNPFVKHDAVSGFAGHSWADALNVLSAASYAFYLALVGRLPSQVGPLRFSVLLFAYGCLLNVLVIAGYAVLSDVLHADWPALFVLTTGLSQLPLSFWTSLAFLLFGATALTYFLNMWALQRVKPSLVGGFVCLQTVFGLFLSQTILHEPLTHTMLVGSALIMAGVLLLATQHFREVQKARTEQA